MSGEAGCFFRDQKRRIGEHNYTLIFSEENKKNVLDQVNKSKHRVSSFAYQFFYFVLFWLSGLPAFQPWKCFRSTVILDLCLRKTRAGKSHDYRDVIVFKKLRFQMFLVHAKTQSRCFQISPV